MDKTKCIYTIMSKVVVFRDDFWVAVYFLPYAFLYFIKLYLGIPIAMVTQKKTIVNYKAYAITLL